LYSILTEFCIPMKLVTLIKLYLHETYSKVHIGKHLFQMCPVQNGLKHGDDLSPLLPNFALEYIVREVQESRIETE
jgi:hypothetical protein